MYIRPRRNRKSAAVRFHAQETHLHAGQLIYPLFLYDGKNIKQEVPSLPGNYRWSLDQLIPEVEACLKLGITTFVLFPAVEEHLKDNIASYSYAEDNFYLHAIYTLKQKFPECCIMTDVAMDPYSSDGHDGFVLNGEIMNDETLPILAKMSVAQAQAGADILGPSDMMDGRIGFMREALDDAGFTNVSIMSYTAKYASAFYGPFRDALDSAPKAGDKKTYQMNPANKQEALLEAQLDMQEGADYLMVKPALPYLDIIHLLKENADVPIAAYNVSGECAMLIAACQNGWLDFDKAMPEMLMSIKRAGADVILTYFAKAYAEMLVQGKGFKG
ncbi:porphobilinogen synthase [Aureispira sp. CCB-E]|uniref:porphobilinogen synthase n=1 Tax=Aureispira sp. CCB-E TaxID=3051121 RepID=UPI0028697E9A|nr:porphobilinogen synthase [Aureispira sp. CCB-E]WMX13282.1 porphobilinogen synthase [Aureispira sp. CCB-E]